MHNRDSGWTDLDRRVSNYPGPLTTPGHRGRLGFYLYTGVFQLIQRPCPTSVLLLGSLMITHYWGVSPSRIVILILLSLWLNRALYVSIFPGTFSDQCLSTTCIGLRRHRREKKCTSLSEGCLEKPKPCASAKKTNVETHGPGEMGLSLILFSMGTEELIFNSLLSCGFLCCCCLVAQLYLTLCDPLHSTLLGSSVHGISQARILEQVAISFSRESSRPWDRTCVACIGRRILYPWTTRGTLWLSLPRKLPIWKAAGRGWDLSSPCIYQGQLMTLKPAQ